MQNLLVKIWLNSCSPWYGRYSVVSNKSGGSNKTCRTYWAQHNNQVLFYKYFWKKFQINKCGNTIIRYHRVLCLNFRTFWCRVRETQSQCDQKKIGKMRDHFLKMRHKMRAYLIQLLNKNLWKSDPLHFYCIFINKYFYQNARKSRNARLSGHTE